MIEYRKNSVTIIEDDIRIEYKKFIIISENNIGKVRVEKGYHTKAEYDSLIHDSLRSNSMYTGAKRIIFRRFGKSIDSCLLNKLEGFDGKSILRVSKELTRTLKKLRRN